MKLILCALALLAPVAAFAEGAERALACIAGEKCAIGGVCTGEDEGWSVAFKIKPTAVDADGVGSYQIHYNDEDVIAQQVSLIGPFIWVDATRATNVLMKSSGESFVWASRAADADFALQVILNCKVKG